MPKAIASVGGNLPAGNFIPEIWSKKLQAKFYASTSLDQIANHDWEGEIKDKGSKVNIRVTPTVTVDDYVDNQDLNYQDLDDDMIELPIDRAKYYAFKVGDIDKAQSDVKIINSTTQDAANNMKIAVEKQVYGTVYADAETSVASTIITKTSVLDWIVDMGTALDEQNAPETGRWLLLPPWVCGMIKKSDLKDASISGDGTSILRNGRMGMIDRFELFSSNNLALTGVAATGDFHCMAGIREAISFASQFVKTETLRLQNSFGDAIRGLNVYGFQVTKSEALVHAPAKKA